MNRIYRVVFNHTLGVWQAVSEVGKGRKKSKTNKSVQEPGLLGMLSRLSGKAALGSLLLVSTQVMANSLPTGGQVVAGNANISQNGAVMDITQTTDKTAINWQSFNIGQGNTVNFHQPSASSVALNRVIGSDVSQIQGALNANGQVFLINPNGILFSQTAQVNVGGLVASTLDISTEDFLAGNYSFEGTSSNAIINQGNITAANGGYIAMIAAKIENMGNIAATGGDVLMGAGSKVTLDMGGPVKIQVEQKAINALIENGGAIKADGGYIYLTAQAAGDLASTVINNTGIIQAQTLATGQDGEIYLMGDMENDQIQVGGTLDASAPINGDGGFIETSAAKVNIAGDLEVTTKAENGQTGEWLIDPTDYTIAASGGDMTGAELSSFLVNSNVEINSINFSAGAVEGNGDIFVNDYVTWSSGNILTLNAQRNIEINATIDASNMYQSGNTGKLVLEYGQAAIAAGNEATYTINAPVYLQGGNNFSTKHGSDGIVKNYTVIAAVDDPQGFNATNITALKSMTTSGNYALGIDINLNGIYWTPISDFTGNFEGLGHTISNLTLLEQSEYNKGLFAKVGAVTSTISNLNLTNVNISGTGSYYGAVAGYSEGNLYNVHAQGRVEGYMDVGGLVGMLHSDVENQHASIQGSSADVDVLGSTFVGGLAGEVQSGYIQNSYALGSVTGTGSNVGGLIGYLTTNNLHAGFKPTENVYALGRVEGAGSVGGLIGLIFGTQVINNAYASNLVFGASNVGGLMGSAGTVQITNSYYDAETNTATMQDAPLGKTQAEIIALVQNGTWDSATWSFVEGAGRGDAIEGYEYSGLGLPYLTKVTAVADRPGVTVSGGTLFDSGWGDADGQGAYVIMDWNQLQNINLIADQLYDYELGSYLDSTTAGYAEQASATANDGKGWTPIGTIDKPFVGNFDGNRYDDVLVGQDAEGYNIFEDIHIADLNINSTSDYVGLFGVTQSLGAGSDQQRIRDLWVVDAKITSTGDFVGGLVGYAQGTYFDDVHVGGQSSSQRKPEGVDPDTQYWEYLSQVSGRDYVGGLIGGLSSAFSGARGRIGELDGEGAGAAAEVSGATYVGGLVGAVGNADVYASGSVGSVTATGDYAGGLVGGAEDIVGGQLYSSSTVTGVNAVGGLFGATGMFEAAPTILTDVGAIGDVTSDVDALNSFAGGLVGWAKELTLSAGYAMGDVTGGVAGGLIGVMENSAASESFSTGEVAGSSAGGLAGGILNSSLENTYTTSTVRAMANGSDAYIGGLVGLMQDSTVTTSYAAGSLNLDGFTPDYKGIYVGAMLGGSFTNNRYNSDATHYPSSLGVASFGYQDFGVTGGNQAYSTAQMKQVANFTNAGWSIDNLGADNQIWRIYEGYTAPLLRTFMWDRSIAQEQTSEYNGQVVDPYHSYPWSSPVFYEADASGFAYVVSTESTPVRDFAGELEDQKDAGTYGYDVFASSQFGANYQVYNYDGEEPELVSSNGLTWEITKRQLSVTGLTAENKVYDTTTDATVSGTASVDDSNIVVTGSWEDAYWNLSDEDRAAYDEANREDVSVTGTASLAFADKNVGNNKQLAVTGLTLTGADAHNYELSANVTANITKANLTVTGLSAEDKVYNATTGATLTGTAAVTALGNDVVELTGTASGNFSNKNVGENKSVSVSGLSLTGADAGNYYIVAPNDLTASITKADLTVTGASAANKVYNATNIATVTGGSVTAIEGDVVTLSGESGTFADKNVGEGKAVTTAYTLSGTDAGNYNLIQQTGLTANITKATLTLTGLTADNKVYDAGIIATLTGTADVVALGEDEVTVSGTVNATFADKNVADGKVVKLAGELALAGADAGNYTVIFPTDLMANITKANLDVTGLSAQNKVYDATTVANLSGTAAVTALGNDDVALEGSVAGAFATKDAGEDKAIVLSGLTLSGVDADNYTLVAPSDLTADITKANLTVTGASAANKVYNATNVATVTGGSVTAIEGDVVTLSGESGTFADKNAGEGKAVTTAYTLSGTDAANYNLIQQAGLTADISKADLTVTGATASNKVYDATTVANVTGGAVNALLDDVVTLSDANATFEDKNVGEGKAVTTAYTLSGTDAGNYNLIQQAGLSANITKANLAVTGLGAEGKVYDATTVATLTGTATVSSLGEDGVSLEGTATAVFADKNAGENKVVTVSGLTLTGDDAGNYTLVVPENLVATISKANLNVTGLNAEGKVYDATTVASLTGTAAISALGEDAVSLVGSATGAFADKNVGTDKDVTVSGLTLTGDDAGNYTLVVPSNLVATITKANLTVTGGSVANKVYDATDVASVTGGAVNALLDDVVTLSDANATFADKNVGEGKAITTAYTLSGTDAGNYNLNQQEGLQADITAKQLTVEGLVAANKMFDGSAAADITNWGSLQGLVGGETLTLNHGSASFESPDVGNDKTVTAVGYSLADGTGLAGNYALAETFATTTANITTSNEVNTAVSNAIQTPENVLPPTNPTGGMGGLAPVSGGTEVGSQMIGGMQVVEVTVEPGQAGGQGGEEGGLPQGALDNAPGNASGMQTVFVVNGGIKMPDVSLNTEE